MSAVWQFTHRPFVRNIAAGAAAAQAVTFAVAPLIARLFGPEAFGLQGVFNSVVVLLAAVAALGYPMVIVLPKRDADARALAWLSVSIGLGTSALAIIQRDCGDRNDAKPFGVVMDHGSKSAWCRPKSGYSRKEAAVPAPKL
jgi:hypothetical protein